MPQIIQELKLASSLYYPIGQDFTECGMREPLFLYYNFIASLDSR